jgi:hypothetical protein
MALRKPDYSPTNRVATDGRRFQFLRKRTRRSEFKIEMNLLLSVAALFVETDGRRF